MPDYPPSQLRTEQAFRASLWDTQDPIQLNPGVFEPLASLALSMSAAGVQQGPRGPGSAATATSCGARERRVLPGGCCVSLDSHSLGILALPIPEPQASDWRYRSVGGP